MKKELYIIVVLLLLWGCGKRAGEFAAEAPPATKKSTESTAETEEEESTEEPGFPADPEEPETKPEPEETATVVSEPEELIYAAKNGDVESLKVLLALGFDVNIKNEEGDTLLHIAAWEDHLDTVKYLLANGADVNATGEYGQTALHDAAYGSGPVHKSMIELLLENGADVNTRNMWGQTPLHEAASWGVGGNADILRLLLDSGADINARDKSGKTPLDHAAGNYNTKGYDFLRENGGTSEKLLGMELLDMVYRGNLARVRELVTQGVNLNVKGEDGRTPLQKAAWRGHRDIVEFLLSRGAKTRPGETAPLHIAGILGDRKMVELLISKGVPINAYDWGGYTPLESAYFHGYKDIYELLLKHGAKPGEPLRVELFYAVEKGNTEEVVTLLERGANVNAADPNLRTILCCAVAAKKIEVVDVLLQKGANSKEKSSCYGLTALHVAGRFATPGGIAELLISAGADINAVSENKSTPLHEAASNDGKEVAELLLANGANADAKNDNGKTPLDLAKEKGRTEMINLLQGGQ